MKHKQQTQKRIRRRTTLRMELLERRNLLSADSFITLRDVSTVNEFAPIVDRVHSDPIVRTGAAVTGMSQNSGQELTLRSSIRSELFPDTERRVKTEGFRDQRAVQAEGEETIPPFVTEANLLGAFLQPVIILDFSEAIDPSTWVSPNFELRSAGLDNQFDGPDDVIYETEQVLNEALGIIFVASTIEVSDGRYRLTVRDAVTDLAGNMLDGDQDGNAGGDHIFEFNVGETGTTEYSDLAPIDITVSDTATSGDTVAVAWTTENRGSRDTIAAWTDQFYLSTDSDLSDDDTLLKDEIVNQGIAFGGSANFATQIVLPERIEGDFFLILSVNSDGGEQEDPASSNNNEIASRAISVSRRVEPDLVADVSEFPTTVQLNVPFDFSFNVRNQGLGDTVGTWTDRLYVSTDTLVDENDFLVGEFSSPAASLPLTPSGSSYGIDDSFTLPFGFDPGPYNLLLVTDAEQTELETDELNNTVVLGPLSVELPPLPDLVVTSIVSPPSALSGQQIPITWTISNQGDASFSGSFSERVFLSDDDQIGDDQAFGTFTFTGEIPVGDSVERTQLIRLPGTLNENRFVVIATDTESEVFEGDGESNNLAIDDAPVAVTLQPFPNLIVSDVTVPDTAFSGQSTVISWTVENIGTRGTNAPIWNDSVYLSTDTVFDPQFDVFLSRTPNQSFLDVGSSYRTEDFQVTLPRGINGPYYFLVIADSDSRVNEFGGEDDNISSGGPTDVTFTPPPDLIVESIIAPTTRISGETARIDWVVRNQGTGSTRTDFWTDRVFLSTDQTLDQDDQPLAQITRSGELLPGETYAASAEFTIPLEVSGDFFFIVETDAVNGLGGGNVFEHVFEDNNTIASETPTTVIQGALSDLEVTNISIPNGARAGELLDVTYTVENFGQTTTQTTAWTDAIYLSSDDQFDPSEDLFLTSSTHFGALAADFTEASRYTSTVSGRVPDELAGTFFVFVVTDSRNGVLELSNDNNTGVSVTTTSFTQSPADLSATQLSVPASAVAGQTFLANWSVQNVGTGSTIISRWADDIVLSSDDVFGNGDDVTLQRRSHIGLIEAGQGYEVNNQAVEIPFDISPGEYFVFLQTDAAERVFEDGQRANNVSSAVPVSIGRDTPDLQVTSLTTANTGEAGRPFNIQWIVTNTGSGVTNANFWADRIYLSQDTTISLDDIRLAEVQRTNPLAPNESYSRNRDFAIPLAAVGEYFVLVQTDARNRVIEGVGESNNVTGTPQVVRFAEFNPDGTGGDGPRPPADLVVTSVDALAAGISGQTIDVSWTVRNDAFATDGEWFDSVYLSLDQVFNKEGDIYLGFAERPNDLEIGESYNQTGTFRVPRGLSGPYYVFVNTDGSDRILEVGSVANNVARDLQPIELTLPPPVDLAVGTITVPASAALNQVASVSYTVSNLSTEAINGRWTDRLYISVDAQWDIGDRLFGSVDVSGPIAGTGSYSRTVEAPLPGVVPGDYHIIVRSDIRNQIAEASEENNIAASIDRTDVDVESLTLAVPVTSNLGNGQSLFYKLEVEEGETLLFELDSDNADAVNEIYVSFGEIPTRSEADFTFANALAPNQRIVVPVTEAGTYYVLAYGQQNTDDQAVTIEANTIDFTVFDEAFGRGGNVGNRTISISGAKFDRTLTATLVNSEGTRIPAVQIWHDTSTQSYATFDLRGLAPGLYDVEVTTASAGSIVVDDGLEVVAGGGGLAEVQIDAPSRVGIGAQYAVEFAWANDGLNDAPAPFVLVGNTTPMFLTPTGGDLGLLYEFVGINQNGGPKGILKPGDFGTLTLYSQASIQPGIDVPLTTRQLANRGAIFDWESVKPGLRPSNLTSVRYDEVFSKLVENVGLTNGDVLDALAENATLISSYANDVPTFYEVMDLEVQKAISQSSISIEGKVFASSFLVPLANEQVRLLNLTTGQTFVATTRSDGTFIAHSMSLGQYAIDYTSGIVLNSSITIEEDEGILGFSLRVSPGSQLLPELRPEGQSELNAYSAELYSSDGILLGFSNSGDVGGFQSLPSVEAGSYTLVVNAEGYARQVVPNITIDSQAENVSVPLVPESTLSVTVSSSDTNFPELDGRLVAFRSGSRMPWDTFQTQIENNTALLSGLPPGEYTLHIFADGHLESRVLEVSVGTGPGTLSEQVQLQRAATVQGQLIVESDIEMDGDITVILQQNDVIVSVEPLVDLRFEFQDIPPGDYQVFLDTQSTGVSIPLTISLDPGETVTGLELIFSDGGTISGNVVDQFGDLLVNTTVFVVPAAESASSDVWTTQTDSTGSFALGNLSFGEYRVGVDTAEESELVPVSLAAESKLAIVDLVSNSENSDISSLAEGEIGPSHAINLIRQNDLFARRIRVGLSDSASTALSLSRFFFSDYERDLSAPSFADIPLIPDGCGLSPAAVDRAIRSHVRSFNLVESAESQFDSAGRVLGLRATQDVASAIKGTGTVILRVAAIRIAFQALLARNPQAAVSTSALLSSITLAVVDMMAAYDAVKELASSTRSFFSDPDRFGNALDEAAFNGLSVFSQIDLAIETFAPAVRVEAAATGLSFAQRQTILGVLSLALDVRNTFQAYRFDSTNDAIADVADAYGFLLNRINDYQISVVNAKFELQELINAIAKCEAEQDDNQPDPDPDPDPNPNDPDPPRPRPKPQPLDDDALEPEPGDDDDPTDDDEPGDDDQPGNGDNPNGGDSPIRRNPILRFFNSDPNDILGPDGFGEQRWVSATENLQYRIRFENDPLVANAPVQQLLITQTLDSDLDPRSFRLGDFGIGETVFSVPENVAAFSKRFDRVEEDGIFIDVVAGIDLASREVFWEVLAIDPATGLEPFDPLLGFLPPNLMPPEGDGFVTYSVRPSRTASTGDVIDAEARIIFDINEPIDTPPIFNTIDAVTPTSEVEALPSQTIETTFDVSWSGTDDEEGSAIGSYDVFVSIDDAPYEKWLDRTTLTTAQFVGELGHSYAFYTVARDNAGNIEAIPQVADATTTTPPAPDNISPTVAEAVIQAGMTQRSYVDSVTFTFDEATNLATLIAEGTITDAVTLTNLGIDADVDADSTVPLSADQFRYTFDEETGASQITWSLDQFAGGRQSLDDGFYQMTFLAAQVTDIAGNPLDGDADGTGNDDYSFFFHRLAGDVDGDGTVDEADTDGVLVALGRNSTMDTWDADPDLDRDGRISVRDRITVARANGRTISRPAGATLDALEVEAISALDTNRDGQVTALDALMVINRLARQSSLAESELFNDPNTLAPSNYDVNGDGRVTSLDALQIINALSRQLAPEATENESATGTATMVLPDHDLLSVPAFETDEDDDLVQLLASDQVSNFAAMNRRI